MQRSRTTDPFQIKCSIHSRALVVRSRGRDGRILNFAWSCLRLLVVNLLGWLRSSVLWLDGLLLLLSGILRLDILRLLLSGVLRLDILRLLLSSILGLDWLLLSSNLRVGSGIRLDLGLLHLMLVVRCLVGSTKETKDIKNKGADDKQPGSGVSLCDIDKFAWQRRT